MAPGQTFAYDAASPLPSATGLDEQGGLMTALLDKALGVVRALPAKDQDEIARAILALAGDIEGPEAIEPEHLPAVLEALDQARQGHFAAAEAVETAFKRFGP
jgi:hypothetical protein